MYRHPGQSGMVAFLPSPAADEIENCDSDMIHELERKRDELNEEIAAFKAQKEREFRDFEQELRERKKKDQTTQNKDMKKPSSALGLFAGSKLQQQQLKTLANPEVDGTKRKAEERSRSPKTKTRTPASKPTLSLDRLNISGTTTPPQAETPPRALRSRLSGSPLNEQIALTPPRSRSPKPGTPSRERQDPFVGVFTPAYLPLLEERPGPRAPTTPPQLSPRPSEAKRLGKPLPLPLQDVAVEVPSASSSLPVDTSVPPSATISPQLSSKLSKRSFTVPVLASNSLPSALRSARTTSKKRKHVMFQMNDGKVVEPSSSYEELPSPEPPETPSEDRSRIDEMMDLARLDGMAEKHTAHGKDEGLGILWKEEATANSTSLASKMVEAEESADELGVNTAGFKHWELSEDGGSGVGFFELDEELESPSPLRSPRSASEGFFDDLEGEEVDAEPDIDSDEEAVEKSNNQQKKVRRPGAKGRMNGNAKKQEEDLKHGSFNAGSLPIDIVRPSGSWIGSFGH